MTQGFRPARFEPQQLADPRSAHVLDEHARQMAAMVERARLEGLRLARSEVDRAVAEHDAAARDLTAAAAALRAAADQLARRDRDDLADLEDQTVRFALEVAEHLVGRELRSCDEALGAAVMRAIRFTPDRGPVVLRINPSDRASTDTVIDSHPDLIDRVEFVADPSVEPGGCVAEVGPLRVDAQLSAAMARVRTVVMGDDVMGSRSNA